MESACNCVDDWCQVALPEQSDEPSAIYTLVSTGMDTKTILMDLRNRLSSTIFLFLFSVEIKNIVRYTQ